jgi:hypothetical protein
MVLAINTTARMGRNQFFSFRNAFIIMVVK